MVWRCSFEQLGTELVGILRAATLEVLRREGESAVEEFGGLISAKKTRITFRRSAAKYEESAQRRKAILDLQELMDEVERTSSQLNDVAGPSPLHYVPIATS